MINNITIQILLALILFGCNTVTIKTDSTIINQNSILIIPVTIIPDESTICVQGYQIHCYSAKIVQYDLIIIQNQECIRLELKRNNVIYNKNLSICEFNKFWFSLAALNPLLLEGNYGKYFCSADYHMQLILQIKYGSININKEIKFVRGVILNNNFYRILKAIMLLLDEEYRLPGFNWNICLRVWS